ncbi:MAG: sigma-70 family RNA polymerase sigma factor [Acidimicrobiales bacterium]|nr:sigma-70 family RNA polymerase sigma factor [Acidimicrobiales bacterium]
MTDGQTTDRAPTWEEVARDYGRFLYTVAYRLTGRHEEAQDLVQEVLLRVHRGLATYQPGSIEGWLSRITTNAFLDEVRRQKRRPVEPLPAEPDRVLRGSPPADDELEASNLPEHVQAALRSLPEEFRVPVVLCDVVGLSYKEIADVLGIPMGTVRSRIHRGRMQMKEVLK